jgi:hypothetical protein
VLAGEAVDEGSEADALHGAGDAQAPPLGGHARQPGAFAPRRPGPPSPLRAKEVEPGAHALARAGGELEHRGAGRHLAHAVERALAVEADDLGDVDLVDHHRVGVLEDARVLQRLVLALGDRQQRDAQVLAEVPRGRAHEVADVLDDEHVEAVEVELVDGARHHLGLEVADGAGDDLHRGRAGGVQPLGVVVGLEVADDDGDRQVAREVAHGALEQRRLARSGDWRRR